MLELKYWHLIKLYISLKETINKGLQVMKKIIIKVAIILGLMTSAYADLNFSMVQEGSIIHVAPIMVQKNDFNTDLTNEQFEHAKHHIFLKINSLQEKQRDAIKGDDIFAFFMDQNKLCREITVWIEEIKAFNHSALTDSKDLEEMGRLVEMLEKIRSTHHISPVQKALIGGAYVSAALVKGFFEIMSQMK